MSDKRTHVIHLMTEDGMYALYYGSPQSAERAFDGAKVVVSENRDWVEVYDDEGMRVMVSTTKLHSFSVLPVPSDPRPRPPMQPRHFTPSDERVN